MNSLLKILKSLKEELRLFFRTPREYLYLFTFSTEDKVIIKPYDRQAKIIGDRLTAQINTIYADLDVHFIGSTVLGIAGQNDIDLYIACSPNDFGRYLPGLISIFGQPIKKKRRFVEWHTYVSGYAVDLLLLDPTLYMYYKPINTFEAIKSNQHNIEEYRKIKTTLHGVSLREYQKRRLIFFNKVLGL